MKKIVNNSVIDVVPCSEGFLFAKKETMPEGGVRAAFYSFDIKSRRMLAIKRSVYLKTKFGDNYSSVAGLINDYIFCDSVIMPDMGNIVVLFPESKMYYIDKNAQIVWDEVLCYRGSPVKSLASDGDCVWCVVPQKNAVVRFSPSLKKVYIRIGGNETTNFKDPVSVTKVENDLYVCCNENKKIRKIELQTYSVKDYKIFDEPVYKYYKILDKEFVLLKSGLYMI